MTAIRDPYPEELGEVDETIPAATTLVPLEHDALVIAVNRLALAIERNTQALQNAPHATISPQVAPGATLTPLPPVQTVAAKPPCPRHGIEKVAPSKQFQGFYCQAKAAPGESANTRGYCSWSVRL